MSSTRLDPIAPTPEEAAVAKQAARSFGRVIHKGRRARMQEAGGATPSESIEIPAAAVSLIHRILTEMASGNAVAVIPVHMELTTQQTADLLGVSRPFVIKLIETGELPHRLVGTHRRVLFKDAMEYKAKTHAAGQRALDELTARSQELDADY